MNYRPLEVMTANWPYQAYLSWRNAGEMSKQI